MTRTAPHRDLRKENQMTNTLRRTAVRTLIAALLAIPALALTPLTAHADALKARLHHSGYRHSSGGSEYLIAWN